MTGVQTCALPIYHFYNFIRKRTDAPIIDWNKRRDTADVVMNENHSADKNTLASSAFGELPKRPIMTLESPTYELGNADVRQGIWTYSIGGGHFFFHDDERQGTARTGVMGYDPKVEGGVKPLQTYDWLGHASRFFNEEVKDLDSMSPCNRLVGKGAYCLANNGREYAIYSKKNHSTIRVDLSSTSGQKLDCRFYSPRTGVFNPTFQRNGGGGSELFTKPSSEDWVLHIFAPSASAANNFTTDGLVALLNFEESGDGTCTDSSGNGHDACLVGTSRKYVSIAADNPSAKISIGADAKMQSQSFTWDIWVEAGTATRHGRLAAQTSAIGGIGPELLIPSMSNTIGVRINNKGAAFNEPTIGKRSSAGPPDHWGEAVESIHRNSGPEHIVLTHDANSKTVRIFVGLKGEALKLSFEATYTGSYEVGSVPVVIGNNPSGGRVFAGNYFQFVYYDKALSYQADGDRNVTGGEVYNNHFAGEDVKLQ